MKLKIYVPFLLAAVICCTEKAVAQLQPETQKQIQALVNEKKSRTAVEQKISSQLLQAIREKQNKPMADGVHLDAANVNADKSGNLEIDIKADVTDALLTKIQALGGTIIFPSVQYHTIRASVNLSNVETIAGYPEVKFIQPATKPQLLNNVQPLHKPDSEGVQQKRASVQKQLSTWFTNKKVDKFSAEAAVTPVISEGDRAHRADDARNTYGYSGEGVRIGVLSDSYNAKKGAATDVLNGELPGTGNPLGYTTPVTSIQDYVYGTDEGRAMLQIVHDLAPKAQLFFATADFGDASFASNILRLRNTYHCDIIIDDVEYFEEPPFEDGPIAQAINAVTKDGALYFSSAGNYGSIEKGTSSVYESDFSDAGSLSFTGDSSKPGSIHNFGTVASPISGDIIKAHVPADSNYYFLKWSDPLGRSSNDYDLFLVGSNGLVKSASTDIQNGDQDPLEALYTAVTNGDRLVVFKDSGAAVRAIRLDASFSTYSGTPALTVAKGSEIFGHSAAVNAFSVAATNAVSAYPNAFIAKDTTEFFSSGGPRRVFYNADTTAITPGNFLFATKGGTLRLKPDVTAADGVSTNVSGTAEFNPYFYGTSAAAPHAGAIAALLKSADTSLTAAQIRSLLTSTALDIESPGYDSVSGYGILQAFQAMKKLNPKPLANILLDTSYAMEGDMSNHNGYIEPSESANIVFGLGNSSLAAATNVSGILSTKTAGVTILQDSVFYGTINASGGININSANPFIFQTNASVPCGDSVNFTLTVNYNGGNSPEVFEYGVIIGAQPFTNIAAKLGTPASGANYVSSTGKQTGRIGRSVTVASSCGTTLANPGLLASAGTGLRTYDAYKFTNTSTASQCVTTSLKTSRYDSIYIVTYNDSGFIADSPAVHYLAEPLSGSTLLPYSYTVAAGKSFTVVILEVYAGTLTGRPYTLDVSLESCAQGVLAVKQFTLSALANQANQNIPLQWTVSSDKDIRFYEVERSNDAIHFVTLQTMQSALSATQKTYNYVDKSPANGVNFYRIKETDVNGKVTYSNVAKSTISIENAVSVLPNPASDFVNIISAKKINSIELFNTKGQLIKTITSQSNFYKLSTSALASGEYFLRIITPDATINKRFIKQ